MSAHPRVVGRYLLFDSFAAGGMATVHLARLLGPRGFSRAVAIKQLHPQFANNSEFVAMLLDEAKLASRVRHSNVVSPLDVVVLESELFVVMDYIHGESLARLLRQSGGPLPIPIVASVMTQALMGLHAAHEAVGANGEPLGMVHRDVSPQNILIGDDGVARVVDFGIAKPQHGWSRTTNDGVLKGKLGYMAPEQLQLETVDRRTDIFTAGIVLWEMLTGTRLFSGETLTVVSAQMQHAERHIATREVADLPPALRQVAGKALARDPAHRYATAREMAAAISAVVAPATPLEVGAWVTHLAGAELRERATRLALLEAVDTTELHATASVSALEKARSLSPVTNSSEATPSAVALLPSAKRARPTRVIVAAALSCAAAALLLARSVQWPKPPMAATQAAIPLSAVFDAAPNGQTALVPRDSSNAAPTAAPLVTPVVPSGVRAEPAPGPVVTAGPKQQATTAGNSALATKASAPAAASKPMRKGCEVPYRTDASGVKRFKPECF